MRHGADSANVRFPPRAIYFIALVIGIFMGRSLGEPPISIGGAAQCIIGMAVIVLGVAVILSGAGLFMIRGTAIIPHKPASHLVRSGIYRWTRNPMYLGMALLYCGLALLSGSIVALLLLPVVLVIIKSRVIAREEAYLERKFGDDYRAYKAQVRRWI